MAIEINHFICKCIWHKNFIYFPILQIILAHSLKNIRFKLLLESFFYYNLFSFFCPAYRWFASSQFLNVSIYLKLIFFFYLIWERIKYFYLIDFLNNIFIEYIFWYFPIQHIPLSFVQFVLYPFKFFFWGLRKAFSLGK